VRVRTYGFPGCFTRPPGTSTRHHPHEPTTSKPVVPKGVLLLDCTAPVQTPGVLVQAPGAAGRRQEETRSQATLRNPLGRARRPFPVGGAASHLSGLALRGSVPRLDST
jgi:hypothetical protein